MLQQIIDRRLAGKNKSIGNRERFLRRYQGAGARRGRQRGRQARHPRHRAGRGHPPAQARHQRADRSATASGGAREIVHPGNKEYVRGDHIERPQGGSGRGSGQGQAGDSGEGEDDFVFHLTKEEFMQIFFDDLALPRLVRTPARRDARDEEPARRLLEQRHAEQPERDPLDARRDRPARRDRRRLARRAARARGRARRAARRLGRRRPRCWRAKDARGADRGPARTGSTRIPYLDPIDLRFRNRVRLPMPTAKAVMFCLMDVSGSMDEARKDLVEALLHPALPVPDAPLREDRPRLHPPPHPGAGGRRGELLPRPRDRRHRGLERAGADGRDHHRALLAERLEHLRRAGERRRQLASRLAAAAASC